MITGKVGHKQVYNVEKLLSSRNVSKATLKTRGVSVLNQAMEQMVVSAKSGLTDWGVAERAMKAVRNPSERKKAEERYQQVRLRVETLFERQKKAQALLKKINSL